MKVRCTRCDEEIDITEVLTHICHVKVIINATDLSGNPVKVEV